MRRGKKVKHNCHVIKQFISALCESCHLLYKVRKLGKKRVSYVVPVIFHNLKGYDSHHIFKNLTHFFAPKDIDVIAINMEKNLACEVNGLEFLDSLQFLNCSLKTLVSNMSKDGKSKFHHMRRLYPKDSEVNLLLRKGVYPYEYVDSVDRMTETCLP